jgi:hypothetical protein
MSPFNPTELFQKLQDGAWRDHPRRDFYNCALQALQSLVPTRPESALAKLTRGLEAYRKWRCDPRRELGSEPSPFQAPGEAFQAELLASAAEPGATFFRNLAKADERSRVNEPIRADRPLKKNKRKHFFIFALIVLGIVYLYEDSPGSQFKESDLRDLLEAYRKRRISDKRWRESWRKPVIQRLLKLARAIKK